MASTIISSPTTYLLSTHISSFLHFHPSKSTNFRQYPSSIPQFLSPWNGLKHLSLPFKQKSFKTETSNNKGCVHASLFGVGAPEALVIGVVALLVFGPKGLAEVARNLGKTLRAFQPTIRELQDVSREFKSTLEREIGLDDIPPSAQSTSRSTTPTTPSSTTPSTSSSPAANIDSTQPSPDQNGTPLTKQPYTTEEYLKMTEEQLKAMGAQQTTPQEESENQSQIQDTHVDVEAPAKPFNIGEVLVQAQLRSSAAAQQEQITTPQETQSQPESRPQDVRPVFPLREYIRLTSPTKSK
ncbi:hypothetical protein ACHQM5_000559 [Ranunculus cassubicifolius]